MTKPSLLFALLEKNKRYVTPIKIILFNVVLEIQIQHENINSKFGFTVVDKIAQLELLFCLNICLQFSSGQNC